MLTISFEKNKNIRARAIEHIRVKTRDFLKTFFCCFFCEEATSGNITIEMPVVKNNAIFDRFNAETQ